MMIQKYLMLLFAFFSFTFAAFFESANTKIETSTITKLESQKFFGHIQTRLPKWQKLFQKFAEQYNVPWALIAAVAYQESKWDHEAVSHTGVKGLMQLTLTTADYIGIDDREDPEQSIQGGSYYLKYLFKKTPQNISNYERWAQALAAYNMGWSHVCDARRFALELNHNPHSWKELRKIIPRLTSGYTRGRETVEFVDNVLGYYQLLNKMDSEFLLAGASD